MNKLIDLVFKYKRIVIMLVIFTLGFGVYSFEAIGKKEFPNTAVPVIIVSYQAPGQTAEEVYTNIIPEVESAIATLPEVYEVHTYTFANGGMSLVRFTLETTDVSVYEEQLQKDIDNMEFTDGVSVKLNSEFNESQIVYAITGEDKNQVALDLSTALSQVDGVTSTKIDGLVRPSLTIKVDTNLLSNFGVSYEDFIQMITATGMQTPLGYVEEDTQVNPILATNSYDSKEDLENTIIAINPYTQQAVYVKDIAEVTQTNTSDSLYQYDGEEAVLLNVFFEDHRDFTSIGEQTTTAISKYEDDNSSDYAINQLIFQPDDVTKEINSIFTNLIESIILVILVVVIGLGFRNSILIATTFPFTVLATLATLGVLNEDLQKVSIAGLIISIGIIVDNSIVMNDAIQHNLDIGLDRKHSIHVAIKDNSIPILTSTLTTIAAFMPIMYLTGVAGTIAYSLPVTVIIALVYSYIMSIFISPLLAYSFLKPHKKRLKNKDVKKQNRFLFFTIKRFYVSFSIIVVILFVTGLLATSLQVSVFPSAEKHVIYVEYSNTQSANFNDTVTLNDEIIDYIYSLDYMKEEIEQNAAVVGGRMPQYYSTLPTLPMTPNQGYIYLDINNQTDVTDIKNRLSEDLNDKFGDVASISANEVELNLPTAPIQITLTNASTKDLGNTAQVYAQQIRELEGVTNVNVNSSNLTDLYTLDLKDEFLISNGIYNVEVDQAVSMYLNDISQDVVNNPALDSKLIFKSNVQSKDELLQASFVFNGITYHGSDLFEINTLESYESFYNKDYQEAVVIDVYLDDNTSSLTAQKTIEDTIDTSLVDVSFGGENDLISEVFMGVGTAAIAAIVAIFIILIVQFNSFKNTFIILLTVPISFLGSIIALSVFNEPFSFSAGLGLTSLMGIIVNNGILLISYIEDYKKTSDDLLQSCVDAVSRRMRPILLSNITTFVGLIPLVLFGGDFFSPMAIALAGGLFTGTSLTLFFIPSVYYVMNKKKFLKNQELLTKESL